MDSIVQRKSLASDSGDDIKEIMIIFALSE
jgi:hypothetical protein